MKGILMSRLPIRSQRQLGEFKRDQKFFAR